MRTIAVFAGLLVASAGLAHAEESTTVVEGSLHVERVAYQAAELGSRQGVRSLRSRVRGAAHRVCEAGDGFVAEYTELRCYAATRIDAFAQIDRAVERWRQGALASAGRIVVAAR